MKKHLIINIMKYSKYLELDKELDNPYMLRETLYNYNDKNKEVVKDLNSIMVLFDFLKYLMKFF